MQLRLAMTRRTTAAGSGVPSMQPLMRQLGPRPTLGELQRTTPWVWLWCERCQHHAPLACAVAVILWGPDASSDKLRAGARCISCGRKGATLQRPGWAGNHIGFYPFPTGLPTKCATQRGTSMDETRRKEIQRVLTLIGEAKGIIDVALTKEQDDLDNMPEDLRNDQTGQRAEDGIDALERALTCCDDAISACEEAIQGYPSDLVGER
jgi:hypothetical protein